MSYTLDEQIAFVEGDIILIRSAKATDCGQHYTTKLRLIAIEGKLVAVRDSLHRLRSAP